MEKITDNFKIEIIYFMVKKQSQIRTTRTPVFWGYPTPPHDYPYYWPVHIGSQAQTTDQIILDPKSKQNKVKINEFAKTLIFLI